MNNQIFKRMGRLISGERLHLFLLYFLLAAGGLWHLLGWFQPLMRLLAAPMLIALSVIVSIAQIRHDRLQQHSGGTWRWYGYFTFVIVSAFLLEWMGVTSGKIFGVYAYGEVLQPKLMGVPVAMGFAWLSMVLSSAGVAEWLKAKSGWMGPWLTPLFIALLMLLFDWVMEPAAVKLGYWHWREGSIPLQNYLAWFVFSFFYAVIAGRLGLLRRGTPVLSRHAWLAQIIYFILVHMS